MIDQKIQEELRAKYNPDGSNLRELQLRLLDMLDYVDEICKENNITYWLSSGTCLGAVRHGGFIPWDDDLDIEMLREDYEKFEKVFVESDKYMLQTYKNELFYTQPFAKIRDKKTTCDAKAFKHFSENGLFVDVFIMESSPYFVAESCHIVLGCLRHIAKHLGDSLLHEMIFRTFKYLAFKYVCIMEFIFAKKDGQTLGHVCGTGCHKNIRMKNEIIPTRYLLFEGKCYPVPFDSDSYLKRMYGDYENIPDKIQTHKLQYKTKN